MSPRAACRLDTLGFEHVYDYLPSKVDWLARGLPTEGEDVDRTRAGTLARSDVVTCGLAAPMAEVDPQVRASPYGFALVVADDGLLLGRLRRAALEGEPTVLAEAVMEPGPSTVRGHVPAAELAERMSRGNLRTQVVASPDGELLGVVRREDAEAAASG